MVVDDVTPKQSLPTVKPSGGPPKVVTREFAGEDVNAVQLAQFGRKLYRFLGCTENMFPHDDTVLYPSFSRYILLNQQDPYYAEALKRVGNKGVHLRRRLLIYVSFSFLCERCLTLCQQINYGVSSVRFDFAQLIRVKTLAYFGIPGIKTPAELVSVIIEPSILWIDVVTANLLWLLAQREPFS